MSADPTPQPDPLATAQSLKTLLQTNLAAANTQSQQQAQNIAAAQAAKNAADNQVSEYTAAVAEIDKLIAILSPAPAPASQGQ